MSKLQGRLIWIGLLIAAFIAQGFAQGGATGAIAGTVQDSSGASIANAEVRITNEGTKILERTVTTGPDGSFTAPLLPVGTYSLAVTSAGFAPRDFTYSISFSKPSSVISPLNVGI